MSSRFSNDRNPGFRASTSTGLSVSLWHLSRKRQGTSGRSPCTGRWGPPAWQGRSIGQGSWSGKP